MVLSLEIEHGIVGLEVLNGYGSWEVRYIMGLEQRLEHAIVAWCWSMYCRTFF
jgi:hypothetical protein